MKRKPYYHTSECLRWYALVGKYMIQLKSDTAASFRFYRNFVYANASAFEASFILHQVLPSPLSPRKRVAFLHQTNANNKVLQNFAIAGCFQPTRHSAHRAHRGDDRLTMNWDDDVQKQEHRAKSCCWGHIYSASCGLYTTSVASSDIRESAYSPPSAVQKGNSWYNCLLFSVFGKYCASAAYPVVVESYVHCAMCNVYKYTMLMVHRGMSSCQRFQRQSSGNLLHTSYYIKFSLFRYARGEMHF